MQVLIIDDEAPILETLKKNFALEGIEVQTCTSAKEAIALHQKHLFAVVITDIRMPEMSGVEVIEAVRKVSPTTIVYVMTGYASLMNLAECLGLGAADYFMKPFESLGLLNKTIKEALERHARWKKDLLQLRRTKI